ncbi:beta 1-4 rhamnosyltransferase Cps2T [Streptococcus sp. DD12]|uniref:beta 1-4 rhamnosyltransferase Cps2T n=1 Tax=Streptococcus sp. DD12 TaxID=1777880 RepID=UPI00082F123F|nr:DUF1972 domain-containing protein [Streptococcus sp. DD12]
MRHVFIIGSRGLPAQYGGFETFVEALVSHQKNTNIRYHVACLSRDKGAQAFDYKGARCFPVYVPKLGPASVIAYDMLALKQAFAYVQAEGIEAPIFYILGNTIGGFIGPFAKKIRKLGGQLWVNPDGLEWRRTKWSKPVRAYLKYAEKGMAKSCDLVISDNKGIERYIQEQYPASKTCFIAYGTEANFPQLSEDDERVRDFYQKAQTKEKDYYLMVSRFVPENNYETIIREFMASRSQRALVIICNQAEPGQAFYELLRERTGFDRDPRVRFVGTVYDRELLTYIRQQAFAYLHGHEVGGTNPGLLEALASTDLNLILKVSFNQEVALDTARYWTKTAGDLSRLIDQVDKETDFKELGQSAKAHMQDQYSWDKIVQDYEELIAHEG